MSLIGLERKQFSLGGDPSEPEVGADALLLIDYFHFLGRQFAINAAIRDTVSGSDKGWQQISVVEARKLIPLENKAEGEVVE